MQHVNEEVLKDFAVNFLRRFSETNDYLRENNKSELYESIPSVLTNGNVNVQAVFSDDKQHVFFRFNKGINFHFRADKVSGDVSNIFDPFKRWPEKGGAAFFIQGSNITIRSGQINGMRPFIIEGENIEVFLNDFTVGGTPFGNSYVDYGLILSYSNFFEAIKDINAYVAKLTSVYFEYKIQNESKENYLRGLYMVKDEMEKLFFDESVGELKIDAFIKDNPIILSVGLSLDPTTFLHAKPMKDIHNDNPKEFIPDLVAYCIDDYNWKIVDYKRAKRSIINNVDKERTTLKAAVHSLISQLDDYLRYFDDKMQSKHYNETHNVEIRYPSAIGIIGRISPDEVDDFNKLKRRLQNETNIVPYNFLYDSFVRFLQRSENLIK